MANFSGLMLGGIDRVQTFTDNNFAIFREASVFFKKYLQLEEELNRNIQKLCHAALEGSKNSEHTSLSTGWEKMLLSLESHARDKADQYARAHTTLDSPLSDQRKPFESSLKSLKTESERYSKDLQNYSAVEGKSRGKYQTAYTEWEQTVLTTKSDLNSHRKATGFTKIQDKIDHLGKKTAQTKAELQAAVNALNDYQKQYYQTHLPILLKRFEDLNSAMGQAVSMSMKGLAELMVELDSKSARTHTTEISKIVSEVNFPADLSKFTQVNGNPNFQIPRATVFEEIQTSEEVRKVIDDSKPASKRIIQEQGLDTSQSIRSLPNASMSSPTATTSKMSPPLLRRNPSLTSTSTSKMQAKTLYACESSDKDELAFAPGEILEILENKGNWWKAKNSEGKIGLVPNNYVQLISPMNDQPQLPPQPQSPIVEKLSRNNTPVTEVDVSVPTLVRRCVEYLNNPKHLDTEGLFRVPGDLKLMKELKVRFEKEGDVDLSFCKEPLTIAGLLKLYFRETEGFPITKQFTKEIIEIWNSPSEDRVASFTSAISSLSPAQFNTLRSLFELFIEIVKYESENKMNPNNLSKVFGLSLLHDLTPVTANSVVELWILHFDEIFKKDGRTNSG